MVTDDRQYHSILIMCVALEPVRYLTRWFMKRGSPKWRSKWKGTGRPPPVCDLASARSPALRVLQYYSALLDESLAEAPRRLRLFFLFARWFR